MKSFSGSHQVMVHSAYLVSYLGQRTFQKPVSLRKWDQGRIQCSNLVVEPLVELGKDD